jgi:AmmeMemoRadiSam system protein B
MKTAMKVRQAAVAGTWYPATAAALTSDVDGYLDLAGAGPRGIVTAVIAPHAGIMFSGPVAACAYKAAARAQRDLVVLVGPSHFVGFDGVALYPGGAFDSPLGQARVDADAAAASLKCPVIHESESPHRREHSLEMQLPFVRRLMPDAAILPLLMGYQTRETIDQLGDALATSCRGRRYLLVASTDLSHYFDAHTAAELDGRVQAAVGAFDADRLMQIFEHYPEHERGRYVACGGGPAIAVMRAARSLGARNARVLKYAHSGEVSGDYDGVVGYLAAAIGDLE